MLFKALFEYCFLGFFIASIAFLLGYLLKKKQAEKKRRQELEEINRVLDLYATLGKTAAKFSHEINNYIGAIAGILLTLERHLHTEDTEVQQNIEIIKQVSRDLISIAKGFRSAVRGHFDDTKKWIYLQDMIEPLLLSQVKGAFSKLDVEAECRCEVAWYLSRRVAEAFLNFIVNSCEAMEESPEKRLCITANRENDRLLVQISDTGKGIPQGCLNRIFEYGFTTKPGGSGQGMSIAKQIVEENNGSVSISSREGEGTVITITFSPQFQKVPNVLLLCADVQLKNSLLDWLSFCQMKLCACVDELQSCLEEEYDLLVMEHNNSQLNIFPLLEVLKEQQKTATAVVICTSGDETLCREIRRRGVQKCFLVSQDEREIRESLFEVL